jgi:CspA family cold shock protein
MDIVAGRVVRFDEIKGYGFIAPSDGGEDVFVHANEITDRGLKVSAGTRVGFRILDGERGKKAYDVRILEDPEPVPRPPATTGRPVAMGNGSHKDGQQAVTRTPVDEELFEVFAEQEFIHQITELILTAAPQVTGAAILELRGSLLQFARKNGWVE